MVARHAAAKRKPRPHKAPDPSVFDPIVRAPGVPATAENTPAPAEDPEEHVHEGLADHPDDVKTDE